MRLGAERKAAQWIGWLVSLERIVAAALLAGVLGLMAAQVVARFVLRNPIAWSEEAARLAFIWLAFIAASFVMAEGRHITVDVVSSRLGNRGKVFLECVSSGMVTAACLLLIFGGFRFVWGVAVVSSPALGVPMSWWYGAATVGLSLIALHGVLNIVFALRTGRPFSIERSPGDEELGVGSEGAA